MILGDYYGLCAKITMFNKISLKLTKIARGFYSVFGRF